MQHFGLDSPDAQFLLNPECTITEDGEDDAKDRAEVRSPPAQVRGFWLGPWMQKESGDPQRVLRDVMGLLADGTIVPAAGALPAAHAVSLAYTAVPLVVQNLCQPWTDFGIDRLGCSALAAILL